MGGLELRIVTNADTDFLYALLSDRDPIVNISHRKMPTMAEHARFVETWPSVYEAWYLILQSGKAIGSTYLTYAGEIGLFLFKEAQGKGIGAEALGLLKSLHRKTRYLANIAPGNEVSARFFERQGFKPIQHTYELRAA